MAALGRWRCPEPAKPHTLGRQGADGHEDHIVTPAGRGSRSGNRVTAERWARILRGLDHRVRVTQRYDGRSCDLLIALHARRSYPSIKRFRREHPSRPIIVALTGTDLYGGLMTNAAQQALRIAWRVILLQPMGLRELTGPQRNKARVILQSVEPPRVIPSPREDAFQVCVLGHLRPVKDPFRAALAVRSLPPDSRIEVVHLGEAMTESMERRAQSEMSKNPRYRWLGGLPRQTALSELARSHVLVQSSRSEGGANAISEALACSVPIVASRIPGNIGLLQGDYPAYFDVGDTQALTRLLLRAETDKRFYRSLLTRCRHLARNVRPANERAAWSRLLMEAANV